MTALVPVLLSRCRTTFLTVRNSRSIRPCCQGAHGSVRRALGMRKRSKRSSTARRMAGLGGGVRW